MTAYEVAFYIGLFGSVHCIGMCGPLAFAVPTAANNRLAFIWDKFVYQAGRIVSYTALGLIIGTLGKQLWLLGLQQGISIASGVLILAAAASRLLKLSFVKTGVENRFFTAINRMVIYAVNKRWGHIFIGMLNGLLPCGFVYLALVGALNTTSATMAAQYMFWFGLGTLPLMFIAAASTGFINLKLRRKLNAIVPYFMVFLGSWFVLRGLSLDIPYLSPLVKVAQSVCH
jgi:sulfite exporter TauE/SafE